MARPTPLQSSTRVVDLTQGIAGAYCTKVLADAGAEVILVEPVGGSPLRQRSVSGAPVDTAVGGVMFQYLSTSKRSVTIDPDDPADRAFAAALIRTADVIVWGEESSLCAHPAFSVDALRTLAPAATVVALSGYGLEGTWAGRPNNQFTWQALGAAAWNHGSSDDTPLMFGGEQAEFTLGSAGALGALVAEQRASRFGGGEVIDVAAVEVVLLTHIMFPITFQDIAKRPYRLGRMDSIPSIHPTKDGWVGLWVTTGQQWLDFCAMVEKTDWLEDASLGLMDNRAKRFEELVTAIEEWTSERTTDEIVEFASLLRLPVAPIGTGETLPTFDHFIERNQFLPNPRSGFTQPAVWYRSTGAQPRPFEPSPTLGADDDSLRIEVADVKRAPRAAAAEGDTSLPFEGLRVVDMTAFWAGPIIAHPLAMLGADVIHVEATKRPDGIRMATTIPMSEHGWWETSPFFNGTNTCKRDLTLDLQTERGRDLLRRLIAESDVLVENYSTRVMDQLGLSYEELKAIKPDIIMVRAPAFGIDGPWRDRVGYAPTIDQAGGLAWVTGEAGGRPKLIGAASDALGGMHGTMSLLLALAHRNRTGEGALVESAQVGTAIQFTGEQVAEFSAHGYLMAQNGNRSLVHAPQGVYRAADRPPSIEGVGSDDWLSVSVESDAQWRALSGIIGLSTADADLSVQQRFAEHDRIDAAIAAWSTALDGERAADILTAAGVPAARVVPPHEGHTIVPVIEHHYFESVTKPVAGTMRVPRYPLRMSRGPEVWNKVAAPTLGQHNHEVLGGLLGLSDTELAELHEAGIIGTETTVYLGW